MAIFIEQPLPCLGKKVLQPEIKIEECVKQTKKLKKLRAIVNAHSIEGKSLNAGEV